MSRSSETQQNLDLFRDSSLSGELVRELRGRRSQTAVSRRLGFGTNVLYPWETGRREPRATVFFRLCQVCGVPPVAALERFYPTPPSWLAAADLTSRDGVLDLLLDLRAKMPIGDIARRMARSRFAVARLCTGESEPRLSDLLRFVDATTARGLDFVAAFVDPNRLRSAKPAWRALEARRRAIYEEPYLPAVQLALELDAYRALPRHEPGWIADLVGIDIDTERRCLALLERSGQLARTEGRLVLTPVETVDTRANPEGERAMKAHWATEGARRIERGSPGLFSFNVFTVGERELSRLEALHRQYFRQLRALVAESQADERLVAVNVQLFPLDRKTPSR